MPGTASRPDWLHWPPDLFEELQERLERFYEASRRAMRQIACQPCADVRETPDRFLIEMDVPGIDPATYSAPVTTVSTDSLQGPAPPSRKSDGF